jgi:hypothetical protein
MATFCSVVNCRRERFERDIGLLLAVWVTRRSVSHVPAEAIQDLGWPRMRAANEALGIDANTIACGWDGSRIDYGMVIHDLVVADGLQ